MAIVGSFKAKLVKVLKETESILGQPISSGDIYFQDFIDHVVDRISIGTLASHITAADYHEKEAGIVIAMLLNSVRHGRKFLDMVKLENKLPNVYNIYVNAYDVDLPDRIAKTHPAPSELADERLREILRYEMNGLREIRKPLWNVFAGRCLDNLVAAVGDPMLALSKMTMLEVQACYKALPKYGIQLFEDVDVHGLRFYPFVFLEKFSKEQLYPTYSLMKNLHGAIKAQSMMEEFARPRYPIHTFLSVNDLSDICNGNPGYFVHSALNDKSRASERAVSLVIAAMRNDGVIGMLNDIPKSSIKKLVYADLLTMDDLSVIPVAMQLFKRRKLSNDLGL